MGLINKSISKNKEKSIYLVEDSAEMELVSKVFFSGIPSQHNKNQIEHRLSSDWCMGNVNTIFVRDGFSCNAGFFDESVKDYLVAENYCCDRLRIFDVDERKYGYLNEFSKKVIDFKYDDASDFVNNMAVVKVGSFYGVIGKYDETIVSIEYPLLNEKSNPIVPFKFYGDSTILAVGEFTKLYSLKGELLYSFLTNSGAEFDEQMIKLLAQLEYASCQLKALIEAFKQDPNNDAVKTNKEIIYDYARSALCHTVYSRYLDSCIEKLRNIEERKSDKVYKYVCRQKQSVREEHERWDNIDPHPACDCC